MTAPDDVFSFVEENGRTYHSYKAPKYLLPNDIREQERMDLQHLLYLETAHGKLYFAPIGDHPRSCLDLMTGTGNWAIDFADAFPGCSVLGTDLSPIQPEYVPVNCRFEVDDAEEEWTFQNKFDFIHTRGSVLCWRNYARFTNEVYQALEPGGWFEMQEYNFKPVFLDDYSHKSATKKYFDLVVGGAQSLGIDVNSFSAMERLMAERGFEKIEVKRFKWPLGTWAKGAYYRNLSAMLKQNLTMALEALALRPLAHLGWSAEEIQVFLSEVRKEVRENKVNAYAEIIYIWGQKPLG
ncbi:Trans-aconitate 2-methyltransferase [Cytospora mali]|uniref:Trans-aconitate 2-methyltransferase n=1 Tax=Cytospora mali TaxID=578113 RepID=A0A194W4L8_CYTMA|nr:Trans-aconitate 2-methyltransferase [Valsa mali]